MKRFSAILFGLALAAATAGAARADESPRRSGYSYVRETGGEVFVNSRYNGRVEARRNLPVSAGDEIAVSDGGRADVALADGNALLLGGGTRARFVSLRDQQGEDDQFSAINLIEGSVVLAAFGDNENQIPRVDTEDATVYLSGGDRVRINTDPRRGTVVVSRAGTVEVRTRAGTFRVKSGEFLQVRGDEEPQIDRGVFSRDRFDLWAADRIGSLTETRSASARYVDDQYASDVVSLDGYGDWQHSDEYGADVWSPRVEAGWTPYSNGSWYYTPAGMTWWSYDPWGWYPHHYGSWFFNAGWSRWCWRPFSVYSPAWVYWAYTPSYVGWCPTGSYSYWSPWHDNYYRHQNWYNRGNVYISINGIYSARNVDFRGWNFVGSNNFGGTVARMDVIPGARIAERLGSTNVAVSSRPIVVNARPGQAREAVQSFVREAPRMVERTASADSARLAPILARERTLSPATLEAVGQRAVVAERGRLGGPGVADIAPRGALVDRNRNLSEIAREPAAMNDRGRGVAGAPTAPRETRELTDRGRPAPPAAMAPERVVPENRAVGRPESDWRSRSVPRSIERPENRVIERPENRPIERARPERDSTAPNDWRTRQRSTAPAPEAAPRSETPRSEGWRSRPDVPPARRVIEGAVPGRRAQEAAPEEAPRSRSWRSSDRDVAPPAREARPEPRPDYRYRDSRESAPAPREFRPEPRQDYRQRPESAPPPRAERPPTYSAPPPPRVERAPSYSAPPPPPPRSEGHRSAPPPPPSDRGRRDH